MATLKPIRTAATRLLQCKTPIIAPPMAGASGGKLAASVSLSGGFGFLASGYGSLENFKSEFRIAESMLGTPQDSVLPIGVGFLGWKLDNRDSPASQQSLDFVLARRVRALWLSFGSDLGKWVKYIRDRESQSIAGNQAPHRSVLLIVVSSVEEALIATNDYKADILVVQGIEAGGHGSRTAPSILSLVPSVASAISNNCPPILAAGGLANGAHLASMLALGASGAVFGTRFLLSDESLYSQHQKEALKQATDPNATVRTMVFDELRGTLEWPNGVDGRALINSTVRESGKYTLEERKRRFEDGTSSGDKDRMLVWAGTGVHLMNDLKPSKDILEAIHDAAVNRIAAVKASMDGV